MRTFWRSVFAIVFAVLLSALSLLVLSIPSAASPELSFYRAIPSKEFGARDPSAYNHVVLSPGPSSREFFVDRTPTVTFDGEDMRSVVGHKTRTSEELNRQVEESMRKRGIAPPKEEPEDYTLTITFSKEAGARFRKFTKEHTREMFDIRLGNERLIVGRIYEPFSEDTLPVMRLSRELLLRLNSKYPGLIKLQIK